VAARSEERRLKDAECIEFLQWALPRLRLRWPGFRKVRRQICRRVTQRLLELGLSGLDAYRTRLEEDPDEWKQLDALCHITISRFYRDRGVFDFLGRTVLPALAEQTEGRAVLRAWSAGCASGEEAYTLALVWRLAVGRAFPDIDLNVLATDVDEKVLRRAAAAAYPESSLRELPEVWRNAAFARCGEVYCLRDEFRSSVTVRSHDLRTAPPSGPFDLVLCRNVAFTYFDLDLQLEVVERLAACTRPGGALVLGTRETLPQDASGFQPWSAGLRVHRRSLG
jgi:chemotaxis protein methyltransferase CheR